jgi:formylglycine-generating enzyme required for sulfatase activity
MVLVGVLVALSVGLAACGSSSSTTTSSESASSSESGSSGESESTADESESVLPVSKRGVVTIPMAVVGDPGNPSVGVVQTFSGPKGEFVDPPKTPKETGIYKSCSEAPKAPLSCLTVGAVGYKYGIGEFAITVSQYVTFLNTVDARGKNLHQLYLDEMSPTLWPRYGSIRYSSGAATGQHYSVAYPQWANKPFNWGDFRRAIRFVNSLTNGTILSQTVSSSGAFKYITYKVRLSPKTEHGMYDLTNPGTTRTKSTGFVLPSNNEWVKGAYYDPKHGGTDSYWAYPTDPFNPPHPTKLNPGTGEVLNASEQPLATYNPNDKNSEVDTPGSPPGAAPNWCPYQAGSSCEKVFPASLPEGLNLPKSYEGNVSTVGAAKTPSPWGTYDMGGNVVENLETLAPQPPGYNFLRNWRYYHGGVANAPAYQLEISAFGFNPGDHAIERIYPWDGFRVDIIGNLE